MKKLWALLFLLVPIGGVGLFLMAPAKGWWLPEDISTYGYRIDNLFNIILAITGVTFVLTQAALVLFMFRYSGTEGRKAMYIHGHHKTEVVWTIIPALILVFIALSQMGAWKEIKFTQHFPKGPDGKLLPPLAEITAGQFEWRIRYPGPDKMYGTADDIRSLNDFHVPVNAPVVFYLKSRDVIHSFFVRELRLKQDAMPGMTIPVWFQATKEGTYDLMCAELCGWGHSKMRGRLTVQSRAAFDQWLADTQKDQEEASQ